MIRTAFTTLALGAALVAAPASASNLLTNGSFESNLTGWNVTSTGQGQNGYQAPTIGTYNTNAATYPLVTVSNSAGNPNFDAAGTKFLYLNSDVGTQTISQNITLNAGTSYTFGFDYLLPANGINNPNGATLSAAIGGNQFATFAALGSSTANVWQLASGAQTFVANQSGTFAFSFTANGFTAKDFAIDRVFLAETAKVGAVPEPTTWAMMIIGFGMVGGATRYRRRMTTVAFA